MPISKLDMSKFNPPSDPEGVRVFYQTLAHAAESAERYEGT